MNKKYKGINTIVTILGVIFFITSISMKFRDMSKNLKKSRNETATSKNINIKESDFNKTAYLNKFNSTYVRIYDGLIEINESLQLYRNEIDKLHNKNVLAKNYLDKEYYVLIKNGKIKSIEKIKYDVENSMEELKKIMYKDKITYSLIVNFYNIYIRYYDKLKNINGTCKEYINSLDDIESSIIKLGTNINEVISK